jgi:hypothetical protein
MDYLENKEVVKNKIDINIHINYIYIQYGIYK